MLAMLLVSHAMRSTRGRWSEEEDRSEVWEQTVEEYSLASGNGDDEDDEDWDDEDWEDEDWDDEDDDWSDDDWDDDDDDDDEENRRRRR